MEVRREETIIEICACARRDSCIYAGSFLDAKTSTSNWHYL